MTADSEARPLREVASRTFELAPPFSFATTVRKPSHCPTPLEVFPDERTYLVLTDVAGKVVGCRAAALGDLAVELTLFVDAQDPPRDIECTVDELARRLGLLVDVSGLAALSRDDALLSALPAQMVGGRPVATSSLYGFLVICIFLQNTTVRRTVQMMAAMIECFSTHYRFAGDQVLPALWLPADMLTVSEGALRALRLGYRARTVERLSQAFAAAPRLEAELLAAGPDTRDAAVRTLYGVGPATANYVGFEWFKELDRLTHVSPWERQILAHLIFDQDDCDADELIAECQRRWAPLTMLAVHAVFESIFWRRLGGEGPAWLDALVRL